MASHYNLFVPPPDARERFHFATEAFSLLEGAPPALLKGAPPALLEGAPPALPFSAVAVRAPSSPRPQPHRFVTQQQHA
jgi:hypothetical protein